MQTAIPLARRADWENALSGLDHAFAHTWDSCYAMQLSTGWPTFLYVHESSDARVVCPFAERSFEGAVDIVTPYGFSGFTGIGVGPAVREAWDAFARARGYVCCYIGLNPLLDRGGSDDDAEVYNEVFVLDLAQSEEVLFGALSDNRKRAIRQWREQGSPLLRDLETLTPWFLRSYPDFMDRRDASSVYSFSAATLEHIITLDNAIILGMEESDEVAAVAVFAHTAAVGDYLFGISRPGAEQHSAALVWAGALELRRRGVAALNLGGGIRPGDGVADFKRRFGATTLPLARLRRVYDHDKFEELCRRAGADATDWTNYFPPYRGPGRGAV